MKGSVMGSLLLGNISEEMGCVRSEDFELKRRGLGSHCHSPLETCNRRLNAKSVQFPVPDLGSGLIFESPKP